MVISLDIQGAFDNPKYSSIRNSLNKLNFNSNTTETLKDILTNREIVLHAAQDPVSWPQQNTAPKTSVPDQSSGTLSLTKSSQNLTFTYKFLQTGLFPS
ncbi:hypothetical protein AVEN_119227-1 [Araneus ventricosus]|uniref:Reverse transcriptase domain-containing protein n=1 Tax=Araneus ventricosus TaxID=182803 RepID=A0A4Y2ILI2_ARAVE|nr:hypothetical protein AVEN_119227-1 [Araneus ventricosus]